MIRCESLMLFEIFRAYVFFKSFYKNIIVKRIGKWYIINKNASDFSIMEKKERVML